MNSIYRYEVYVSGKSSEGFAKTRYIIKDNREDTSTRYEAVIGKGNSHYATMCSFLLALQELNSKSNNNIWRIRLFSSNQSAVRSIHYGQSNEISQQIRSELRKFLAGDVSWIPGADMDKIFGDRHKGNRQKRKGEKYNRFISDCLKRDNKTCQNCGSTTNIHVHHIVNISSNNELVTNVDNGICLCKQCHTDFHVNFNGGFKEPCNQDDLDKWMSKSKELNYYVY